MANNKCNVEWGLPLLKRFKSGRLAEEEKLQVNLGFDTLFDEIDQKRAVRKQQVEIQVDKQIQDAEKKYFVSVNIIGFEEFGLSVNEYCRKFLRFPKELVHQRLKPCNLCKLQQQLKVIKYFFI